MMCRVASTLCLFFILFQSSAQIQYPYARKVAQVDDYHGIKVSDPYRWLENDTSAETKAWADAQNKLTSRYLSIIPFREQLKRRMAKLYSYQRYSIPSKNGEYLYYFRNNGLQNQPVLFRQRGLEGDPQVIIDANKLSVDGTTELEDFVPSKNGRYAAWALSRGGSDWRTIFIKDMSNLRDLPDSIQWVKQSEIAWQNDGFFYSRYPAPEPGKELSSKNENHQVWYHKAGTSQKEDRLVYGDTVNRQRFHYVYTDEEQEYVFLTISDRGKGLRGNALYFMAPGDTAFRPIVSEVGSYLYGFVEMSADKKFIIETNDHAPNSKIVLVDPGNPAPSNWQTLIAEQKEPIQSADVAGGYLFVRYLKDVTSRVTMFDLNGMHKHEVKLPGPGTVSGFRGLKEDTAVFFSFTSFIFPPQIYRYDLRTGKSSLFRRSSFSFRPDEYTILQEFYKSKDGTSVPIFIVHKKSVMLDGSNPTLLYGYGGFNITIGPSFSTSLIAFLEQGGVYAVANLRGGSEYGESWHEAGMLDKKQNVFDDFIAAGEYLIKKKYTSPAKLAIRGGSNGGLLVGAVMNQRPDLFKVAIPEVGVMDMLRFQRFTIGWNWIAEYGSSDNKGDFTYLYKYSPLHNLKEDVNYPATMIVTADHDDRVVPAHSFKFAATLQEKYKGPRPMLIRIDANSGHGASSVRKNIELAADIYSFVLYNLGAEWQEPK